MASSIRSAFSLYMFGVTGVFLLVVPWTPVWRQAVVTLLVQPWADWAMKGWFRGLVSGIGALDLVVAGQVGAELWSRLRAERHRGGQGHS